MEPGEEISVSLGIAEFLCEPEEISNVLGMSPSRIWRKDQPIPPIGNTLGIADTRPTRIADYNKWVYRLKLDQTASLDQFLSAFLDAFWPFRTYLSNLAGPTKIYLSLYLAYDIEQYPNLSINGIIFNPKLIQLLADLRASVGIDINI